MTQLQLVEKEFETALDLIVKTIKGAKFDDRRYDGAKTVINLYGKLNQTESAKRTNQLIAIKMVAKDEKETRMLVASSGLLDENLVKKLTD